MLPNILTGLPDLFSVAFQLPTSERCAIVYHRNEDSQALHRPTLLYTHALIILELVDPRKAELSPLLLL